MSFPNSPAVPNGPAVPRSQATRLQAARSRVPTPASLELFGSLLIGCLLGLSACNSPADDDAEPPLAGAAFTSDSAFEGVWKQRGYARILAVEDDTVFAYDATTVSCVPTEEWDRDEVAAEFERIRGNRREFSWYEAGAFTRYEFDKLEELPAACSSGARDARTSFEALTALFGENYGFFEERGIDWDDAQSLGKDLDAKSSAEDLMDVFKEILTPFGDGHVYVFDVENGQGFLGGSFGDLWDRWANEFEGEPFGENPANPREVFGKAMQEHVLLRILDGKGTSELYDMIHWGWLQDDVGYIDVHAMGSYEAEISITEADALVHETMEQVMTELGDAKAIVVDARFNEGGYDTVGYAIAAWFNDEERVVSRKKARLDDGWTSLQDIAIEGRERAFTGPVYLLISRNTISAAETFTLAMRELPQVTLVGERTYGSLSDALVRFLPNGWMVSLSNEVYESPSGEAFEALGIPPDEEVRYDAGLSVQENLDLVLAKTLELIAHD